MNAAVTSATNGADPVGAAVVGKAISDKLARKVAAPATQKQEMIDPALIRRREGWNPRFDFGEVDKLAGSIEHELAINPVSGGLINDIRVMRLPKADDTGAKYVLIDGDRRLQAIEKLLKKGIVFPAGVPAKVEPYQPVVDGESENKDQLVRMYTANTGKAFLPMEEAAAFDRMKKAGMTIKEIAQATGRHVSGVTRAAFLLKADSRLTDAVAAKKIGSSAAIEIQSASRGDPELLTQLIDEALAAKTKTAKKAVSTKIKAKKVEVAKKEGRKLKMRALTNEQLSALGSKMSDHLAASMKALGLDTKVNPIDWLKGCEDDVKLGYALGVLQGLKAAAGLPVDLLAG